MLGNAGLRWRVAGKGEVTLVTLRCRTQSHGPPLSCGCLFQQATSKFFYLYEMTCMAQVRITCTRFVYSTTHNASGPTSPQPVHQMFSISTTGNRKEYEYDLKKIVHSENFGEDLLEAPIRACKSQIFRCSIFYFTAVKESSLYQQICVIVPVESAVSPDCDGRLRMHRHRTL